MRVSTPLGPRTPSTLDPHHMQIGSTSAGESYCTPAYAQLHHLLPLSLFLSVPGHLPPYLPPYHPHLPLHLRNDLDSPSADLPELPNRFAPESSVYILHRLRKVIDTEGPSSEPLSSTTPYSPLPIPSRPAGHARRSP